MKAFGKFDRVIRVFSSRKILKLTHQLRKILCANKLLLKQSINHSFDNLSDNSLIYCGINNINIISNGLRTKKTIYSSNSINVLSFYLSISGMVYHIKSKVKLNDKACESKTFYTPSKSSLVLLLTISDKNIQKIVYENGIDIIFNFFKYFGVDIKNVYDIKHLLQLYSTVDQHLDPEHYSQIIRAILQENKGPKGLNNESSYDTFDCLKDDSLDTRDYKTTEDNLILIKKSPSFLVSFARIHNLRSYLYSKYGINNRTFNLRMDTVYREIKLNPRIYSPTYEKKLDSGTLKPKILEDKLLSSLLNDKTVKLKLLSNSADLSGIILYHFEGKIILNIHSFYVDENKGEIFPLYGVVTEDNIKYFGDKKVGDIVHCTHEDLENISIKFTDSKPCMELKRFNQDSLVYVLRNKKYVQFNQIHN